MIIRVMRRVSFLFFVIVVVLTFITSTASVDHYVVQSGNDHHFQATQSSISTSALLNQMTQVEYLVIMGTDHNLSQYAVDSTITYSAFNPNAIHVFSTFVGNTEYRDVNATFLLSDFVSFPNLYQYYNATVIPNPFGTGESYSYITSSASNNLIRKVSMITDEPSYNLTSYLFIKMTSETAIGPMMEKVNYNSSLAYLFIPQLLPPSIKAVNYSTGPPTSSPSPNIIPIPPGGGSGNFLTDASGTMHIYDSPIPDYHLWDATSSLAVTWTNQGGPLSDWSATHSYTIDRNDWYFIQQGHSTSSTSNSFTYTYALELGANFPFQGYLNWESIAGIMIKITNQGSVNVQMLNMLYFWTGAGWALWTAVPNTNQNGGNGASFSVTAYILEGIQV